MQVKSIAECSPYNILQYFWQATVNRLMQVKSPALSDIQSWKTIFIFFCEAA